MVLLCSSVNEEILVVVLHHVTLYDRRFVTWSPARTAVANYLSEVDPFETDSAVRIYVRLRRDYCADGRTYGRTDGHGRDIHNSRYRSATGPVGNE